MKLSEVVLKYSPLPLSVSLPSSMDWGVPDKVLNLFPGVKEIIFERHMINIPIESKLLLAGYDY